MRTNGRSFTLYMISFVEGLLIHDIFHGRPPYTWFFHGKPPYIWFFHGKPPYTWFFHGKPPYTWFYSWQTFKHMIIFMEGLLTHDFIHERFPYTWFTSWKVSLHMILFMEGLLIHNLFLEESLTCWLLSTLRYLSSMRPPNRLTTKCSCELEGGVFPAKWNIDEDQKVHIFRSIKWRPPDN